jgi:hypothetical protein
MADGGRGGGGGGGGGSGRGGGGGGAGSLSRAETSYVRLKNAVVLAAGHMSISAVCRRFHVTRGFVRYWLKRFLYPALHSGTWGGARRSKFTNQQLDIIFFLLFMELRANPLRPATELTRSLVSNEEQCRFLWYIGTSPKVSLGTLYR